MRCGTRFDSSNAAGFFRRPLRGILHGFTSLAERTPTMSTIGYLNGQYVDQDQMRVPVTDTGFMLGVTVAEQLRTFAGSPFQVHTHLERLARGLAALDWLERVPIDTLPDILTHIVQHNRVELADDDDLGVTLFVTPGTYSTYVKEVSPSATIGVHSYPLPFHLWSRHYRTGQSLQIVNVRQVSPQSWPPEIKCRSRMHYYRASQQASQADPEATALLLDERGNVSETPIANIVLYFPDEGLVSPREASILPGISLAYLQSLAQQRGIPFVYRDIAAGELPKAEEILLTSTPYCILPATRIDGQSIGKGIPGPMFLSLIQDWSESVGCDIVAQASRYAGRN